MIHELERTLVVGLCKSVLLGEPVCEQALRDREPRTHLLLPMKRMAIQSTYQKAPRQQWIRYLVVSDVGIL